MTDSRIVNTVMDHEVNISMNTKRKLSKDDYEFIERDTEFGKSGELGKGAFGVVRLVQRKDNPSKKYAMKMVRIMALDTSYGASNMRGIW